MSEWSDDVVYRLGLIVAAAVGALAIYLFYVQYIATPLARVYAVTAMRKSWLCQR
jgi:hypothetical protein